MGFFVSRVIVPNGTHGTPWRTSTFHKSDIRFFTDGLEKHWNCAIRFSNANRDEGDGGGRLET